MARLRYGRQRSATSTISFGSGGGRPRKDVDDHDRGVLRCRQVIAREVAYREAGRQGCTHEPWPRSSRMDCITWNVVLSVNTSAAASTPLYFSMTGAAAVATISSRPP